VVIANRFITQWGHEARYNYRVKNQELERATVTRERPGRYIRTLTFRAEPSSEDSVELILDWEYSRVGIPMAARSR
jgi:hypothetical protein